MIDPKYAPRAQRAVDLLRTALLAVEECGADPMLTSIVVHLGDAQMRLRSLFELPGPGLQIKVDLTPEEVAPIGRYRDEADISPDDISSPSTATSGRLGAESTSS